MKASIVSSAPGGVCSSVLKGRQMLLEEDGYRVLTATSGKDALQVFASNPVDLVLFDQHMPQINNGDVTAIHMRACRPDVPIALLSCDEPNTLLQDWQPQD
jgi:CheY-like chemotaxis protein